MTGEEGSEDDILWRPSDANRLAKSVVDLATMDADALQETQKKIRGRVRVAIPVKWI